MIEFKGTPKTGANWAINLNNPKQTLIENVCIIDEGWDVPGVKEDAYLIAAAQDLLDALQNIVDSGDLPNYTVSQKLNIELAISAIQKALNIKN